MKRVQWSLLGVLLLSGGCLAPGGGDGDLGPAELALGPLMYAHPLVVEEGSEAGFLGPVFYQRRGSGENNATYTQHAIRPLFSHYRRDDNSTETIDVLFPLLTYHRTGSEYRVQIGQWIGFSGGASQTGGDEDRTTLFPFYFARRSGDPERDYTAVFPFYGTLKNRMLRDEIKFIAFPLYAKSRKGDIVTRNYLFPVFHLREGENLKGWRMWPLAGFEEKTIGPEGPGEKGGHRRTFVAWPFYHNMENGIGTDKHRTFKALLPLYAVRRSARGDLTSVAWPFFNKLVDKENGYTEYTAPWPFIIFGEGPNKKRTRVWPLYGRDVAGSSKREFFLWPLYQGRELETDRISRRTTRILFPLIEHMHEERKETGEVRDRKSFWPLFTRVREGDASRLQVFTPLEPLLPKNKAVARNYSPLFALWHARENAATGTATRSFLFNLYRGERTPQSKKCSLLFGLIRYKKDEEGKELRLFWLLPFRSKTDAP